MVLYNYKNKMKTEVFMKIAMGNDHAAVDLKMQIMEYVK